jgi:glycosyltransferase 2 family protein
VRFAATFRQIDPAWFAASMAVVMLTYVGRAIRWRVMIRPIKPHPSLWNIFHATVVGFTAVVLFGRAGELVRPYLIAKREKVPVSSQLATWFLERIYDLLSVLLLFGFALSRVDRNSTAQIGPNLQWVLQTGGHLAGVLATLCFSLLITFGLFPGFVERQLTGALQILPEPYKSNIVSMVQAFLSGTSSTRRFSFVAQLVAYTFGEWLLIVACFLCVFRSFAVTSSLGFMDSLIVVGFVAFGSAVQIPGIGGGMQVATVLVLTELYGFPLETASGVAILLWVVAFLLVVPFGLALAFHDGLKLRKLLQSDELPTSI